MPIRVAVLLVIALLSGCAGAGAPPAGAPAAPFDASGAVLPAAFSSGKIKHVVIIVQENRSFDELFRGFPGADTVNAGVAHDGTKITLTPRSLNAGPDVFHKHISFLLDYDNGKNDGFDRQLQAIKTAPGCPDPMNRPACWTLWTDYHKLLPFTYVPQAQIQPYWTMAQRYALSDRTFASNNGPSYGSHQYMIAGTENHIAEIPTGYPWGCDANRSVEITYMLKYGQTDPATNLFGWPLSKAVGLEQTGPFPCFSYPTVAGLLDAKAVTWSYYAPAIHTSGDIWSAFDAISPVRYGPDWQRVKSPETTVLNDVQNGTLAQVSWVMPSGPNSDHSGACGLNGPDWVASIVNAIGNSKYWNDTAIVVTWDEWGGYYDHVPPPQYPDPQTGAFEGLGFRVPLIVISPYARRGYVSHKQHEIASTLHFIEKVFALPSLGGADKRADALEDMFNFAQSPAAFKPIPPINAGAADFLRERPSLVPPDDD